MKPRRVRAMMVALVAALLPLLGAPAFGQTGSVEFELGLQGAVVQGAWNPLRVVLRDLPAVELELIIDQGSLRSGPVLQRYRVSIPPSRGLSVFEDDLFVPSWRSLSWAVRSAERTIASGSLDARLADSRPLTLLVTRSPGRWLTMLPEGTRAQEAAAPALPTRAAAYSGVDSIVVDGTGAVPSLESLLAAAAAGVVVVLEQPLPVGYAELAALTRDGSVRLGAGWLVVAEAEDVRGVLQTLPRFPIRSTLEALLVDEQAVHSPPLSRATVSMAGGVYALLVVLMLRFGNTAGLPAALIVAAMTAVGGWMVLRPAERILREERALVVSAGGLGFTIPAMVLRSLPGGVVTLDRPLRFRAPVEHEVGRNFTSLSMTRWQREVLLGSGSLTSGVLQWEGERLRNLGVTALEDVFVSGSGPQGGLGPGQDLIVVSAEWSELPRTYDELLALLPPGTALAREGDRYHVALPADPRLGL